jgi:hypothetical protein
MTNLKSSDTAELAHRRQAFKIGGAAALGLSAMASSTLAAPRAAARIVRARFTFPSDWTPVHNQVNRIPWTTMLFNDGVDCKLDADNKILIRTPGLYRIALGCDWVAQNGTDIDLRKIGIRRQPTGTVRDPRPAGFPPIDKDDDRLASVDVPGSDPPRMARFQGTWRPGFIAAGAMVTAQVTVSPPKIVLPGDLAFASHGLLSDAGIGSAAADALIVQAKVVAPDTVRVSMYNPLLQEGVTVPSGPLQVVAMSSTLTRGESADAWQVLHTPTEELSAGDRIYGVVRSLADGDYIQATKATYIQIEKVG